MGKENKISGYVYYKSNSQFALIETPQEIMRRISGDGDAGDSISDVVINFNTDSGKNIILNFSTNGVAISVNGDVV